MKKRYILFVIFISGFFFLNESKAGIPDTICNVHYINIGQGAATLLEFSCGAILIDAGAQSNAYVDSMIFYIQEVLDGRPDLNNTLESVMITHDDMDHRLGLREVMDAFTVNRIIYNGVIGDNGDLAWAVNNPEEHDVPLFPVSFEIVTAGGNTSGLSSDDIDPVNCNGVDPVITILSGGFENNPGWSNTHYKKGNNHSLVIRLDLGEASFLFTGDLEKKGIETVFGYYASHGADSILDVDVYHVGHHGSHNATNEELIEIVTPEIAVISVGKWNHGKYSGSTMSTYRYGHPRRTVVNLIEGEMPQNKRNKSIRAKLASKPQKFRRKRIRKKIYATAWDGNIRIKAMAGGGYIVYVNR